ncbi:50S ribosomal protein L19 [Candidatus Dojkabacteria bacterium]|nr:50S ribosomal protein L19 [Candidatus Dojkabacteria bacterium]
MDTDILNKAEQTYLKTDIPEFEVGDTIAVHTIIREKGKQRIQVFKGVVIAIKGSGTRKTFTVRKVATGGIGVEKILPLHSPNIKKIEFIKKGKVKRSKIYYMRKRIGKLATKISEGEMRESMKKQHESLKEEKLEKEEIAPEKVVEPEVVEETEVKTEEKK